MIKNDPFFETLDQPCHHTALALGPYRRGHLSLLHPPRVARNVYEGDEAPMAVRSRSVDRPKSAKLRLQMKKLIIPALALTILQNTASARPGTATGPTALALTAVIARHSPAVRAFDKRAIARLFHGNTNPNTK